MINKGIVAMLSELAAERDLEKDFVLETLKESLITAARKKYGRAENLECEISEASGSIRLYLKKVVKENVTDPLTEISLAEARKVKPTIEVGAIFKQEIPVDEFGRNAINIVKNTLIQKIKTNEKEMLYEKYKNRAGELVSGTVSRVYPTGAYIKIGDIEAFLPKEEQIPNERLKRGAQIKALIKKITQTPDEGDEERIRIKGPIIYLSRIQPEFIARLLEFEIPEILHSKVEIKDIARKPGVRAKVSVYSENEKVDAVGSCVGHKGSRIRSIVKELAGEKVDVVHWKKDKAKYAEKALSPVKVIEAKKIGKNKVLCVVPDEELTGAIGKLGENVALASELIHAKIDIKGVSEYRREKEKEEKGKITVDELDISDHLKDILKKEGLNTAYDILSKSDEELSNIKGIGKKKLETIHKALHSILNKE
ncbi:MAG: transcription termination factor NusA [candidate division WOR-3 bacterium]